MAVVEISTDLRISDHFHRKRSNQTPIQVFFSAGAWRARVSLAGNSVFSTLAWRAKFSSAFGGVLVCWQMFSQHFLVWRDWIFKEAFSCRGEIDFFTVRNSFPGVERLNISKKHFPVVRHWISEFIFCVYRDWNFQQNISLVWREILVSIPNFQNPQVFC